MKSKIRYQGAVYKLAAPPVSPNYQSQSQPPVKMDGKRDSKKDFEQFLQNSPFRNLLQRDTQVSSNYVFAVMNKLARQLGGDFIGHKKSDFYIHIDRANGCALVTYDIGEGASSIGVTYIGNDGTHRSYGSVTLSSDDQNLNYNQVRQEITKLLKRLP